VKSRAAQPAWTRRKARPQANSAYGSQRQCHRCTKPILLLADEFSVSSAEIFAALFRDSKRGPILGRTAGAGGSIPLRSHGEGILPRAPLHRCGWLDALKTAENGAVFLGALLKGKELLPWNR